MPLAENTKEWLKELAAEGSLTEEDQKLLEETLGKDEKVAKALEESVLRQSDYDRSFNKRKKEFDEKEKATLDLKEELVTWRQGAQKKLQDETDRADNELKTRQQMLEKIKAKAQDLGISPTDLGLDEVATPPKDGPSPKPETKTQHDKDFVTKDEVSKVMGESLLLPALLHDIGTEHQELFGKPLTSMSTLIQKAAEQKKSFREVWETEFEVPERRKAIAEQRDTEKEKQIREDERQKVLSDLKLPTRQADAGFQSPVLSKLVKPPAGDKDKLSPVQAAVGAYSEGKYRPAEAGSD